MSINRVVISGNLTRDAELRRTQSGMAILNLGVAVNDRRRNNQTGEWEDYPNYIDCTLFGNRATAIKDYMVKGQKVAVEGKLRWSQWEDKETGKSRNKVGVLVDEIEFMGPRNGGGNSGGGNSGGSSYSAPEPAPAEDDDVPF